MFTAKLADSLPAMRRSFDRARRSWAACFLILTLVLGWGAEAVGDCGREELGEAGAGIVCLHGDDKGECGDPSRPADAPHHHGAHCFCPCHGLTMAPGAPAGLRLELFALVNQPLPDGLTTVDLPSPLRPPIAA